MHNHIRAGNKQPFMTKNIALVSLSTKISLADLAQTAAALQKQATRDLGPIWDVEATVDYFPDIKSIPHGYWPIIIAEDIEKPDIAGYHTDNNNQPYCMVKSDPSWQLTCSHEMCEMLVDPCGNRLVSASSIMPGRGKVSYLVEVCDPCEDASFAYSINGILVSDFYTRNYFDSVPVSGMRYSFTGSITKPLEIKKNGYLSWVDPINNQWYQATYFGTSIKISPLEGMKNVGASLRSKVDKLTKNPNQSKAYTAAAKGHKKKQLNIFASGISMSENISNEIMALIKPKQ